MSRTTRPVRPRDPRDVGKFAIDLAVGGASAAISKTAVAPIERVKLLLQVQYSHKSIAAQDRYKGIMDAFIRVPKEQGFISFWRGNMTNVMRYFPTQALNFAFNDLYKSLMLAKLNRNEHFWKYTFGSLAAGGCAGSTTLCFVYPLDFIRTRLSVDVGTHKTNRDYTGFMDCLRKTVRSDGVVGLYRGFFISIQTYFIYRAVYFGMYDTIRQFVQEDKRNLHFVSSFLIAQGVSICSAYLTYPWDTVRRRMMIKGTLSTKRAFAAAKRIVVEEGVRGLFKGALANIFRSSGGALVMAIYEEIQKHLFNGALKKEKLFCFAMFCKRSSIRLLFPIIWLSNCIQTWHPFIASPWQRRYSTFSKADRLEALSEAREMFYFGYENYMEHAFPADELDPIHCTGRGHDHSNPSNININDVLGDYSLTLIDSLDTLVVLGDHEEFKRAVSLVIDNVSFEKNTTVQVFEATIRVIGSLLSAHLIVSDESRMLGDFYMPEYEGELLTLAHDLAARLLPAFEGTRTGIPYPRVNLMRGVLPDTIEETCTAGAGSLLVEFGILSRLLGDQTFERTARRINERLWQHRDENTGLPGNVINIQTGEWVGHLSGVGAGLDSFYEYFLKAYILFGEPRDLQLFNEAYDAILANMRRGRIYCNSQDGEPPLFVNVDSRDGSTANTWIDALQASFAGLLVLAGHLEEAICQHAFYYAVWSKYGVLPERYNWYLKRPDVNFYPLRPEFVESTYFLYQATKNPFYLHVGKEIMESLNSKTRVKCGFATVHNVDDGSLEDRMESFFLAETMKYLYLLFDEENPVNIHQERLLFTTEGHIVPILHKFRKHSFVEPRSYSRPGTKKLLAGPRQKLVISSNEGLVRRASEGYTRAVGNSSCETTEAFPRHVPPLNDIHMKEIFQSVGLMWEWWS